MPQIKFTDQAIARLKPAGTTVWYSDQMKEGLRLAVGQKSKTFYFSKRHPQAGKVLTIKIGRHPALSVSAARRRAEKLFSDIEQGNDPTAERRARDTRTLQVTLDAYIRARQAADKLSDRTANDYRDVLRLYASDWLERPLHRITSYEFETRFLDMANHPHAANKFARVMRQLYRYAKRHDPSLHSPAHVVDLYPEYKRQVLTTDWAEHLENVLSLDNLVRRNAWLLLWHTGIRSSNLRGLKWEDVDLQMRTVHLSRMKNRQSRTLPLSRVSTALFQQLRPLDQKWCFPSFKRSGPIDHLDSFETGRPHDMRHLFVTAAGLCHLPEYVIAFLKGDAVNQSMVQHYFDDLGEHSASDAITAKIITKCMLAPDSFLESIQIQRISSHH